MSRLLHYFREDCAPKFNRAPAATLPSNGATLRLGPATRPPYRQGGQSVSAFAVVLTGRMGML